MKRVFSFLLILASLLLCSCSVQPANSSVGVSAASSGSTSAEDPAAASPLDFADQLLSTNVFSEPLEWLDPELAPFIYQLDESLVPTAIRAYRSSGSTCEEVAVFIFANEADASAGHTALTAYLSFQVESNRNYRPAQISKLEHALLVQHDNVLYLVVANDWVSAAEFLK